MDKKLKQLNSTTWEQEVKTDPKDKISVVLGDDKDLTKFQPQAKIQRWDNEANISVRLKEDKNELKETPVIVEEDGKIKYKKSKKETHFYDIAPNEEHPEGAFETEIVLLEKPDTNVVEFTVVDKEVDYFYQAPLTPEEIAQGSQRPENVEGSYAVYAKTPKTNWTGGKEYKCGKIGHIFRPKIIDSAGTEVWGDLHIENGILSVTIPQDFLDKAVYPVRHAAGLTFGYTGAGTSTVGSALSFEGSRFTGVAGTGVSMSFSVAKFGGAGSVNWQSNIYIQSTSALLTNGVTTEGSGTGTITKQWKTANFASAPTFSAVDYLLFLWSSDPSFGVWPLCIYYDTGSANQGYIDNSGGTYKTWPSTGTFSTFTTNKISIYATYTAAGGTAVLTGTIVPTVTEADIVTGGKTTIITLTGDTWIAAGTTSFDLQRQNIINGCTSAQSEALGWNIKVKALQSLGGVVRTSSTVVTITWDAEVLYNITATETITVTIPSTALVGAVAIVATPTFSVTATGGATTLATRKLLLGVGL